MSAIDKYLNNNIHFNCSFHLYNNSANLHRRNQKVRKLFFAAAGASTEASYFQYMDIIEEISLKHYNYYISACPRNWASCYCLVPNYRYITSSVAESLNSMILSFRGKNYCDLLISIRKMMISRHVKNTKDITGTLVGIGQYEEKRDFLLETIIDDSTKISAFGDKLLRKALNESSTFTCYENGASVYLVVAHSFTYKVEIYSNCAICTCNYIKQMGFPCSHILFVSQKYKINYYQFISKYYNLYFYCMTYLEVYKFFDYTTSILTETDKNYKKLDLKPGAIKRKRFNSKSYRYFKLMRHSRSIPENNSSKNS